MKKALYVFALVVFLYVGYKFVKAPAMSSSPASSVYQAPRPNVGDKKNLHMGESSNVVVPKSKDAFDLTVQMGLAGSDDGIASLVAKGDCFLVDAGTSAIVVESYPTYCMIIIQSGPMKNKIGFIPNEFLK